MASELELERQDFLLHSSDALLEVSDWSLLLFLELLFNNGYSSPGTGLATSQISLQKRIGSNTPGKQASKRSLRLAAKELEDRRLLRRERASNGRGNQDGPGTPFIWTLQVAGNPDPDSIFESSGDLAARITQGEKWIKPSLRAGIVRFALASNQEGIWTGSEAEAIELLQIAKSTLRLRLGEMAATGFISVKKSSDQIRITVLPERISDSERTEQTLLDEIDQAYAQILFPDEIKELVEKLKAHDPNLPSDNRVILNWVLNPMIEIQNEADQNFVLIRQALRATLDSKKLIGPDAYRRWPFYCRAVIQERQQKTET